MVKRGGKISPKHSQVHRGLTKMEKSNGLTALTHDMNQRPNKSTSFCDFMSEKMFLLVILLL